MLKLTDEEQGKWIELVNLFRTTLLRKWLKKALMAQEPFNLSKNLQTNITKFINKPWKISLAVFFKGFHWGHTSCRAVSPPSKKKERRHRLDKCEKLLSKATKFLDQIAGLAIIAVMLLVVANVILRATVGRPILGTYEFVGFLTAIIIGLALAHCAFQNGHIAVDFIMKKFPDKVKVPVDFFIHLVSLVFLALSSLTPLIMREV